MELEKEKRELNQGEKAEAVFFRVDKAKEALDALKAELEGLKAMNERIAGGPKDGK